MGESHLGSQAPKRQRALGDEAAGAGGKLAGGSGAEEPNGLWKRLVSGRSGRPGTLTPEWRPRKRQPLRASDRPLRAGGSV